MKKCVVTFIPDNKKVVVDQGTTLLAAAISAHIHLNSSCGGDGVCGKCRVFVKGGFVHAEPTGRITPEDRERGAHLACQALVESDIEVQIPPESRLDLSGLSKEELSLRLRGVFSQAEEIQEPGVGLPGDALKRSPLVKKFYFELPKPDFDDKLSDLERICRALEGETGARPIHTGLANVRRLGSLLRSCDWKATVAVAQKEEALDILAIEPGRTCERNFGFVFDIGTTTITAQLVDLNSSKVLGTKVTYNRQATFGSDVITRIIYAEESDGLEKLHHAIIDVMNEMIETFAQEHAVDLNDATCLSVAGNTTMIHLLLRIDPTHIRQEPYVPTANLIPVVKAAEAGIKINPHGLLFCVPGVASYVGGDITSGVLACSMQKSKDVNLLIDIGTNGEIVLGNKEWMIACAASAGPAFEGSGMSCGLRAVRGAIEGVEIIPKTLDVEYTTIGADAPKGICGSGYIDIVCELLKHGVLDKNGKINRSVKNKRVRPGKDGYEFVLTFAEAQGQENDTVITDADLDNLKRAKGAIYSAIALLVRHMGIAMSALKRIFIAGGFGTSLDIESAVQIGLIPDLPRDKFLFVGNSSLAGARMHLLSFEAFKTAQDIARNITYFELSTDPQYMDEYMAALFFPHTDIKRFPSVTYI